MVPALSRQGWQVLLIGGSSGVGKTVIAHALARKCEASVLLVDDIRLAIQQVTTPAQHPGLHVFVTGQSWTQRSPEQIRDGLIEVGTSLTPALKIIIAHHVAVPGAGRIILEGDGILPYLAAHHHLGDLKHFCGLVLDREIRSVFLYEEDEQVLQQNLYARGRSFHDLTAEEQRVVTRGSWLYGRWLRNEAEANGLPVLPARPHDSLQQRILEAI